MCFALWVELGKLANAMRGAAALMEKLQARAEASVELQKLGDVWQESSKLHPEQLQGVKDLFDRGGQFDLKKQLSNIADAHQQQGEAPVWSELLKTCGDAAATAKKVLCL